MLLWPRDRIALLGWSGAAALAVVAVVRAATAAPLTDAPPATEVQRKTVFWSIAGREPSMRRDAAKDFPADAWSQDDAFHNLEYQETKKLAGQLGIRLSDGLRALDDGMHEGWPRPPGIWLRPTVPPCRPRPIH